MLPEWLTAQELRVVRGGSLRAAQDFIAQAEARGWCRTCRVPSRRGRPARLIHRGDYEAIVGLSQAA